MSQRLAWVERTRFRHCAARSTVYTGTRIERSGCDDRDEHNEIERRRRRCDTVHFVLWDVPILLQQPIRKRHRPANDMQKSKTTRIYAARVLRPVRYYPVRRSELARVAVQRVVRPGCGVVDSRPPTAPFCNRGNGTAYCDCRPTFLQVVKKTTGSVHRLLYSVVAD